MESQSQGSSSSDFVRPAQKPEFAPFLDNANGDEQVRKLYKYVEMQRETTAETQLLMRDTGCSKTQPTRTLYDGETTATVLWCWKYVVPPAFVRV